jgi:hypothetical protein
VTKSQADKSLPAAGNGPAGNAAGNAVGNAPAGNAAGSAPAGKTEPPDSSRTILPKTAIGRRAVVVSAIAMASWIVLPATTITFRHTIPITDTWVMPAIGTLLTDGAAIFNVLAVWRWRERSVLSFVLAVLMAPIALFFTFMVVGEGLGGV